MLKAESHIPVPDLVLELLARDKCMPCVAYWQLFRSGGLRIYISSLASFCFVCELLSKDYFLFLFKRSEKTVQLNMQHICRVNRK